MGTEIHCQLKLYQDRIQWIYCYEAILRDSFVNWHDFQPKSSHKFTLPFYDRSLTQLKTFWKSPLPTLTFSPRSAAILSATVTAVNLRGWQQTILMSCPL